MFERLMLQGAALAQKAARRRRSELAEALAEEAPEGTAASETDEGVLIEGRGLRRRFAVEPGLRWLLAGRRR